MDALNKHIYIIGPNAEKNEQFVGVHLSEEWNHMPGLIKTTTEKVHPADAIMSYVILDKNEDWLFEYTGSKQVILVEDF